MKLVVNKNFNRKYLSTYVLRFFQPDYVYHNQWKKNFILGYLADRIANNDEDNKDQYIEAADRFLANQSFFDIIDSLCEFDFTALGLEKGRLLATMITNEDDTSFDTIAQFLVDNGVITAEAKASAQFYGLGNTMKNDFFNTTVSNDNITFDRSSPIELTGRYENEITGQVYLGMLTPLHQYLGDNDNLDTQDAYSGYYYVPAHEYCNSLTNKFETTEDNYKKVISYVQVPINENMVRTYTQSNTFKTNDLDITFRGIETSQYTTLLLKIYDKNGDRIIFEEEDFTYEFLSNHGPYRTDSNYNMNFSITNPKSEEVDSMSGEDYLYGAYGVAGDNRNGEMRIKYTFNDEIEISKIEAYSHSRSESDLKSMKIKDSYGNIVASEFGIDNPSQYTKVTPDTFNIQDRKNSFDYDHLDKVSHIDNIKFTVNLLKEYTL
jgi:hypothetical protein